MRVAIIGYGRVARAFARLLERQRKAYPFRIVAAHTLRHGSAYDPRGLPAEPDFGPAAASAGEFLDRARAEVMIELTPLNPENGEPAATHIRAAFARGLHVITANKGPIACAYAASRQKALRCGVEFRHEAATMDGAPVFSLVRNCLPGVTLTGFAGVLNSTTTVILDAMERGAALANVLMDARVTPARVNRKGIGRLTPQKVAHAVRAGKTIALVSRASRAPGGVRLRVRAEVLDRHSLLASVRGASNLLVLHTDMMGDVGVFALNPGLEQTAYGVFSDLVDIARSL